MVRQRKITSVYDRIRCMKTTFRSEVWYLPGHKAIKRLVRICAPCVSGSKGTSPHSCTAGHVCSSSRWFTGWKTVLAILYPHRGKIIVPWSSDPNSHLCFVDGRADRKGERIFGSWYDIKRLDEWQLIEARSNIYRHMTSLMSRAAQRGLVSYYSRSGMYWYLRQTTGFGAGFMFFDVLTGLGAMMSRMAIVVLFVMLGA